MSNFTETNLFNAFTALGLQLLSPDEKLMEIVNKEIQYNGWFTANSVLKAVKAIGRMLNKNDLGKWLDNYPLNETANVKRVGLILAGNIPLVGFHDVLCVLITGNYAVIKSSTQDSRLIKYILERLVLIEPAFSNQYSFEERLLGFDAVIATGSNNTSRYFEYYFGKVPHIIRKNRNSIAVLTGDETSEQLYELGHDIFDYFGLGCRNVSKLLVPDGYNFGLFFESIEVFSAIINHHKYNNNYFYNKSILLVNNEKHLDNNFLLLKEDQKIASPLGVLYFEYYNGIETARARLMEDSEHIQCVVSSVLRNINNQVVDFGQSQQPALWDYADGVDTMAFLRKLD